MSLLKIAALAVASCLVVFLGYKYVTADPPGYCRMQQRYISDDEFIKASIAMLDMAIKERRLKWQLNPESHTSSLRVYARVDENRKRSGFIQVLRDDTHTVFRWLFGYQQIQVTLNANSGDEQIRYSYDVCGRMLEADLNVSGSPATTYEIINSK